MALVFGSSSCTYRLTDFTVISTRNVPLGKHAASIEKANTRVKGKDTAHMILFIPLGAPNMKEAIDRALDKYPGAIGLADGVVKNQFWWAILYGQNSYLVEGTPLYEGDEITNNSIIRNNSPQIQEINQQPTYQPSLQYQQPQQDGYTMVFFHEVKQGDTLNSVASSYGVTVRDIIRWNQLSTQDLTPGSKIKILMQ